MNLLNILKIKSDQTVFRTVDLANLLNKPVSEATNSLINYYIRSGQIFRLSKGLYTFINDYSKEELGNKLRTPSYLSFTSVLQKEGLLFQPYDSLTYATNRSEVKEINGQRFRYRKLKDSILFNSTGLEIKNGVMQATPERALLDWWYLDGEQPIDRPGVLNWKRLAQLNREVYSSKRLAEYLKKGA